MKKIKELKKVYTHAGVFHADDVFCVALLKNLGFDGKVVRVPRLPDEIEETAIVIDIGGKYDGERFFDHHQSTAPVRDNGVKYAAFGQLVKSLAIREEKGFETFDSQFVCGIDARDNGQRELSAKYPSPVGDVIKLLNPNWDSKEKANDCFEKAVELARNILSLEFERRRSIAR